MRDFQIYLSGGMSKFGKENFDDGNQWRVIIKNMLTSQDCQNWFPYNLRLINPNDSFNFLDDPPEYASDREIMNYDIRKALASDLVIVSFIDPASIGTAMEQAIAYNHNIPVLGLNDKHYTLHPWQRDMCERVFENIEELVDYVIKFYLS